MTGDSLSSLDRRELRRWLAATAGVTGVAFFGAAVVTLGELLEMESVFVGERVGDKIRRLATWNRQEGEPGGARAVVEGDGSLYLSDGTPCELLLESALVRIDDLEKAYPGAQLGGLAYLGASLGASSGQSVGVLCAFGAPAKVAAVDTEVFGGFARRTAAELERFRADSEYRERTQARLEHQSAQLAIAQIREHQLDAALRGILPIAARTLRAERTSYWSLDAAEASLACQLLHVVSRASFTVSGRLDARSCPAHFAALRTGQPLDAGDALGDPRTCELRVDYLEPHRIGSLLDVPVWRDGRLVGVLRIEHVGGRRSWAAEEQDFATYVAGAISVALEASVRARAEERYRLVSRATGEVVWEWDIEADAIAWSDGLTRVFGHPADPDGSGRWRFDHVHSADRERVETAIRAFLDGTGTAWSDEYRFTRGDGTTAHVVDRGFVTRDGTGRALRMTGSMQDVTAKKALEARLLLADRMASMGMLAAGIAHEINNPLASVKGGLEYVIEKATEGRRLEPDLELAIQDAREGAVRVQEIVGHLKMFSRPDAVTVGPVDVDAVVESSIAMSWSELKHRARLVRKLGGPPPAAASEARLGQVVLNLLVNAAHAIPEAATGSQEITVTTGVASDKRVFIEVGDTGPGMSREVHRRIFEPFFTTKEVGEGTGLGLTICHSIVSGFGGEISAESEPGRGARFRVLLPAAVQATTAPARGAGEQRASARRARILVVDDDASVATTVRRILRRDHDVTIASGGAEALALIETDASFDVIVCDVMMPGVSGIEVHAELVRRFPELARQMVFVTGGVFTPRAREFLADKHRRWLEKPFDVAALRAAVASLL